MNSESTIMWGIKEGLYNTSSTTCSLSGFSGHTETKGSCMVFHSSVCFCCSHESTTAPLHCKSHLDVCEYPGTQTKGLGILVQQLLSDWPDSPAYPTGRFITKKTLQAHIGSYPTSSALRLAWRSRRIKVVFPPMHNATVYVIALKYYFSHVLFKLLIRLKHSQ